MAVRTRITLLERFFTKVDQNGPVPEHAPELGPCWLWTGAKDRDGYGQIRVDGVLVVATRMAWKIAHGLCLDVDVEACHRCDNPSCVRPSHIFAGSHRENHADAVRKGRYGRRAKAAA